MKVILFNGSRNEKGSTYTALSLVAEELNKNGIETEFFWVGERAINGQIDQMVDEAVEKIQSADGMVLGSPVYYASPSGELIAFLDRFYWKGEKFLRFKPAAAVTVARRAGTTACTGRRPGFAHFRLTLHPSLRAGRLSAVLQSLAQAHSRPFYSISKTALQSPLPKIFLSSAWLRPSTLPSLVKDQEFSS